MGGNGNGNGGNGKGHLFHLYDLLEHEQEAEGSRLVEPEDVMEEDHLDCQGRKRRFRLQQFVRPDFALLEAIEIVEGTRPAWQFRIPYDPETQNPPYGELRTRIRDRLATRDLVRDADTGKLEILTDLIRAQIICPEGGPGDGPPDLIIDGDRITWDEMGRLLMCYEGWGLRIKITEGGEE